jgi:serine protease
VQSSINIEGAWAAVSGSSRNVVVAVLDTGVRFDHPDLRRFTDGGSLLNGYDFVTNEFIGNDGSAGRDDDPSDPGDWLTAEDLASDAAKAIGCTLASGAELGDSSWHGTQTAGLLGAITQNSRGMASVGGAGRRIRVLPVRVLGKCGGFDSDVIPAMRWAAGLNVPGVPDNPNPARVINLSLGGVGACSAAYADAIREITRAGVVVVAAAGNTDGGEVNAPANCTGVIGVAGLRHLGTKVGYSDLGPEIAISAPAGNCVNVGGVCLYPLLTTTNSGTTTPVSADESYTDDGDNATAGTSFSSPLVAGTAALMLVVQSSLSTDEVRQLLQKSARTFPTSGDPNAVGTCPATASGGSTEQSCYCTTSTCGAGMLDASAAVALAQTTEPASESMAGALGWGWLLGLAAAVVAVSRSRREG